MTQGTGKARTLAETLDAAEQSDPESYRPYLAGEVIADRYKLETQIGRGGMGVVWVAHSLVLGIDVALKLIRADAAAAGVGSRMAREAHAAARLGHPALVRVFDFGWTNRGDPFLVMELVQGDTLGEAILRGSMNAIRAVQILLPIADGLRVAHERSIIHRDIKPDNILLSADALGRRQPKLLDFGIAKVEQKSGSAGKITQMGAVLGSPEYMSPEQALGQDDIDPRTDVWSLSIVLYEMITGKIPFNKPNYNALMHAIINDDPEPTTKHGEGDGSLWTVLKKGLAKDRSERWADMTEFGMALALWLYEHGIKEDISGNSIRAVWLDHTITASNLAANYSAGPIARSHSGGDIAGGRVASSSTSNSRRQASTPTTGWGASALRLTPSRRLALVAALVGAVGLGALLTSLTGNPQPEARAQSDRDAPVPLATATPEESPATAPHPSPEATSHTGRTQAPPSKTMASATGDTADARDTAEARDTDTDALTADERDESQGPAPSHRPAGIGASSLPKAPNKSGNKRPNTKKRIRHDFGF